VHVHRLLVDGVTVEYRRKDGSIAGAQARIIDFGTPANNDWLAVNQFTVAEGRHTRRPDIVLFVNGLPLAVIELKNPADENATIWSAFQQLQTYQAQVPALFATNAALVISDGVRARIGSLGAGREWFKPWRTISGREDAPVWMPELQVVLAATDASAWSGTRRARARADDGLLRRARHCSRRWRTRRSWSSPTATTSTSSSSAPSPAARAAAPEAGAGPRPGPPARTAEKVASGGVVFTTIQKFLPAERGREVPGAVGPPQRRGHRRRGAPQPVRLSHPRRQEHRRRDSGPGLRPVLRDGLPNASYIGFTGTPIELTDKNTRAVFGDYISVYDIQRAVDDGATVPIYYESRLAQLSLSEDQRAVIDDEFEEVTEHEEVNRRERLKSRWAALEAVVGSDEKRIERIAEDIVRALRAAHRGDRRQGDDRVHVAADLRRHVPGDPQAAPGLARNDDDDRARSRSS
jgi:type I restriction enzyme R subunit